MSEEGAHEAVVSSLMDIQARLRGDGTDGFAATRTTVEAADPQDLIRVPDAAPAFVNLPDGAVPAVAPQVLSVVEDDVTVEVTADEDHRFAPADSRLAALTERLARLELELDGVIGQIEKVDPTRIDRLEAVQEELDSRTEDLKATIDSHFTDLQRSIDERLRGTEV